MHSKMMKYDRVIRKLNEYRKQGYSFGLINSFGEASISSTSGDSVSIPFCLYRSNQEKLDAIF